MSNKQITPEKIIGFNKELEQQLKRQLEAVKFAYGAGKIEEDNLYDSKLGIFALGYMSIDTLCCEHRVYLQVGNSIQSFR